MAAPASSPAETMAKETPMRFSRLLLFISFAAAAMMVLSYAAMNHRRATNETPATFSH